MHLLLFGFACAPSPDLTLYERLQDGDGDGLLAFLDCDDTDPTIHGNAGEPLGESVDLNCDGKILCAWDADGDGYGVSTGTTAYQEPDTSCAAVFGDCDDGDPAIHPGAKERIGNLVDENCDGETQCENAADADGDSVCNDVDQCPGVDDRLDEDGDSIPDGCDPCPHDERDDQDGDGQCDSLDLDRDGDGTTDEEELVDGLRIDSVDTDGDLLCDGTLAVSWCVGAEMVEMTDPLSPDTDRDGLRDGEELAVWLTEPTNPDTDEDGASDGEEVTYGSDPFDPDSDNDGLRDGIEYDLGGDLLGLDGDGDGITDYDEVVVWGSSPGSADGDGDGWTDVEEIFTTGTDPSNPDTDGDNLNDADEAAYGLDPLDPDADGDGMLDGDEIAAGADPFDVDSDDDGLYDGQEVAAGSDPTLVDTDGDGLDDAVEVQSTGTDPALADSDADGLSDPVELYETGTDPTESDTDNDGLIDGDEIAAGTDPHAPDSDLDCLRDGDEAAVLADPAVWDTDGDGLHDGIEVGGTLTDPSLVDSDVDGLSDAIDAGLDCTIEDCTLCLKKFYVDSDEDGFGSETAVAWAEAPEPGVISDMSDCDDADETVYPGAPEVCDDGQLNACDGDLLLAEDFCGLAGSYFIPSLAHSALNTSLATGAGASSAVGDLDGDGNPELFLGAPDADAPSTNTGALIVWTMTDLANVPLDAFHEAGVFGGTGYGTTVAAADGDGDGFVNVAVGEPEESLSPTQLGRVYLYNGPNIPDATSPDAKLLAENVGRLGSAFAASPDALMVGAAYAHVVYEVPWDVVGTDAVGAMATTEWVGVLGSYAGSGLALADLDGDGVEERLIGAPGLYAVAILQPIAGIGSIADADAVFEAPAVVGVGSTVTTGDADGDGLPEWATAAPASHKAWLMSASTGELGESDAIATFDDPLGSDAGESLLILPDFRGDGAAEWFVGAPGAVLSGRVWSISLPWAGDWDPSLATLTLTHTVAGEDLGASLAAVPDRDGDGAPELYVGQRSTLGGAGYVLWQYEGL